MVKTILSIVNKKNTSSSLFKLCFLITESLTINVSSIKMFVNWLWIYYLSFKRWATTRGSSNLAYVDDFKFCVNVA